MKTQVALAALVLFTLVPIADAGHVVPVTVKTTVCQNGFCRPGVFTFSAVVLCKNNGKTLLLSCSHFDKGGKVHGLMVDGQYPAKVLTVAADADLALLEIDTEPAEWTEFIVSDADPKVSDVVWCSGYGDKPGISHLLMTVKSDPGPWVETRGWPQKGQPQLALNKLVPEGYSGGSVSRQDSEKNDILLGITIQTSPKPEATLFVPASKINSFLDRIEKRGVHQVCRRLPKQVALAQDIQATQATEVVADFHADAGPLASLFARLGCKQPPPPARPGVVPAPRDVPLTSAQIRAIISQWFAENRSAIAASIPPQKIPQIPVIPPSMTEPEIVNIVTQWFNDNRTAIAASIPAPKSLSEGEVKNIVTEWFNENRAAIIASLPAPKQQTIPPITVQAWEQVLDSNGAPVGEPVLKGSESYPIGTPVKIIHYKMLPK